MESQDVTRHESQDVTQHEFVVETNEQVARDTWRMRIASSVAQSLSPGQFMNISVPGDQAHLLRLPLSFSCADAATGIVELSYAVVGEGTRRLSRMRRGEASTLLGPCGVGWRLPGRQGRALVVAGGIGLPPIEAAGRMLAAADVPFDAVIGAKTAALLVDGAPQRLRALATGACEVVTCTDDGTQGRGGLVTGPVEELLATRPYAQVYACGPNPMMAAVAGLAREAGVSCQVSLERMMGCGFGACSCCNVALAAGGYALCCQDGPVFDAEEVAW